MPSFRYKLINKFFGKAIHAYDMISDGDKIAVGVSGGKDSLTLLWFLHERLSRIPVRYELFPIHIDPGFEGSIAPAIEKFCENLGYNPVIEYTDFGIQAHGPQNRENPCFLCSRLRRKRLFEISDRLGCEKLALGHNKDDIIETLFLNMFYAGEISTMTPSQLFFQGKFRIIRPLAFIDEEVILKFTRDYSFPGLVNPCPSANTSKRREIKDFLKQLYKINPKIKGNIFRSMTRVKTDYLL